MAHPFFEPTPLILGHRGAAAHAPENTLLSFERAIELGAGVIESDVQASRDGVPVLMHDAVVDRVTNGAGVVESMSLAELQALDAGHHFSIGDRGELDAGADGRFRGRGLRVETELDSFTSDPFQDALERIDELLKGDPPNQAELTADRVIISAVYDALIADVATTARLMGRRMEDAGLEQVIDPPASKSVAAMTLIADSQGGFRHGHRYWV